MKLCYDDFSIIDKKVFSIPFFKKTKMDDLKSKVTSFYSVTNFNSESLASKKKKKTEI